MKHTLSTKKLVTAALMAALTVVGSALRITLPLQIGDTTSFHLGNIMCALSGILLGPWLGGLAAGMGSGIYDMTNPAFIEDCWITFVTKGLYGVAAGLVLWSGSKKLTYRKAALASAAGAILYAVLYLAKGYFYDSMLIKGLTASAAWIGVLGKLPATVFNAAVAIIFAPMLAVAIHRALEHNHLTLE